jgi:autotransporter-associated beta strand protein
MFASHLSAEKSRRMMTGRNIGIFIAFAAAVVWAASEVRGAVLSSKRGFADGNVTYDRLQATGAGWYYTWEPGPKDPGNYDAKFLPMIHFHSQATESTFSSIKNRPGVEYVLGFNEPERADQANMTVAQAISDWTSMSTSFAGTGIKLVSPAVSDDGAGRNWLSSFMSQAAAADLPVDAIAFHWYGASDANNPAGAASSFLSRVTSYHNTYNKPIFITEFAIHDWNNNETDAQIIEANRQFLDIVIPQLEARDYVLGYSWYHWFEDAPLYEPRLGGGVGTNDTLIPTPMGYSYVGVLATGQTDNLSGQDFGEHVAYLAGGELTNSGAAPGTVRYINALSGSSTISGTEDWNVAQGGWVRIQANATLRKLGVNQITFSGFNVLNNGTFDVARGELRMGPSSSMSGSGRAAVYADGTLVLDGGRMERVPLDLRGGTIRADSAGTLLGGNVYSSSTLSGTGDILVAGALAEGTPNAGLIKRGDGRLTLAGMNTYSGPTDVLEGILVVNGMTGFGKVTIAGGAALEGIGTVRGDLLAQSASTIRGRLHVGGNYMQEDGATLALQLTDGPVFDRLMVDGELSAGGELAVTLAPGYLPALGQTFDLLDFNSFVGGFDLSLPDLGAGLGWDSAALATTGALQVVASTLLAGDYNQDGSVDAADYTLWRDMFGQMGTDLAADGSGPSMGVPDGVVDELDYEFWKVNFGNTIADSVLAQSAPEPTTITQLLLVFAIGIRWRRRPIVASRVDIGRIGPRM